MSACMMGGRACVTRRKANRAGGTQHDLLMMHHLSPIHNERRPTADEGPGLVGYRETGRSHSCHGNAASPQAIKYLYS